MPSCNSNPVEHQSTTTLLTHYPTEELLMSNDDWSEAAMSKADNFMGNQFSQTTNKSNISYMKDKMEQMFEYLIEIKKQQATFQKGLLATLADMKKAEIKTTNMLSRLNTKKRLPKCFENRIPIASVEQFLEVERVLKMSEENVNDLVRLDSLEQIYKVLILYYRQEF